MNEVRKEKLRILNLVEAIKERGIADVSVDFPRRGATLAWVVFWGANEITDSWSAYSLGDSYNSLVGVRQRLEQMYKEALGERRECVA